MTSDDILIRWWTPASVGGAKGLGGGFGAPSVEGLVVLGWDELGPPHWYRVELCSGEVARHEPCEGTDGCNDSRFGIKHTDD